LAGHEHGGVGSRHLRYAVEDALEGGRRPDDLLEHRGSIDLVPEDEVLRQEPILESPELRLGPLSVFDVGEEDVPAGDLAARIAQRKPANLKPAVNAVESPDPRVEIVGLARRDRPGEELGDMREIVDVNGPVRAPMLHLRKALTAILDDLLVDELDLAGARQTGDQAGNGLDDELRSPFALREIAVKARLLQRGRGLSGEEPQH